MFLCVVITLCESIIWIIRNSNIVPYRLGDVIRHWPYLCLFYPSTSIANEYTCKQTGGRICLYLNLYTSVYRYLGKRIINPRLFDRTPNYRLLTRIVNKRIHNGWDAEPSNVLSIHIRLGDVIENNPKSVKTFLEGEGECKTITNHDIVVQTSHDGSRSCGYVRPLSFYRNILTLIPSGVDTVHFVGGCHQHCGQLQKSKEYIRTIADLFRKHGYKTKISVKINSTDIEDVDRDFVMMASSSYFVPSGGGFSNLVAAVVRERGGSLLGV